MGSLRLPTRITRRAKARSRFGWARSERATVGLAAVAIGGAGVVIAGQFSRLLRRRAHERRSRDGLLEAAPAAAADTVNVAVRGYVEAPRSETVLFNLLAGFLGSFALVRISTLGIRDQWGPFRNVSIGGRHIHHFVPGILLAFASGGTGLVTKSERIESMLAFPFGAGIGLTFDVAALLLDLEDVYWSREGLLSVQITLAVIAMLGALALALRFLWRGEQVVLEPAGP